MPMPSNPFPGMNPFLQTSWSDVHTKLIAAIGNVLSEELPSDLSARAEERVTVAGTRQEFRPDLVVVEPWRSGFPPIWAPDDTNAPPETVTEPIIVMMEPQTERWLEIRDVQGRLVTVLEVLSPANKSEQGAPEYRRKQQDFLAAGVNMVEIDLVRGGQHVLAVALNAFARPPGAGHLICVTRRQSGRASRCEVYPCPLREPLPVIRVPLRAGDPDAPLALQPLIDQCYRSGRYWLVDHQRELDPRLSPEDTAWVDERLKAAGLK